MRWEACRGFSQESDVISHTKTNGPPGYYVKNRLPGTQWSPHSIPCFLHIHRVLLTSIALTHPQGYHPKWTPSISSLSYYWDLINNLSGFLFQLHKSEQAIALLKPSAPPRPVWMKYNIFSFKFKALPSFQPYLPLLPFTYPERKSYCTAQFPIEAACLPPLSICPRCSSSP